MECLLLLYIVAALNVMYTSLNSPKKLKDWEASGGDPCADGWTGIECSGSSVTEMYIVFFTFSYNIFAY